MPATYALAGIQGPTVQGEGPHAGHPCLLVRLAGCNAWDGRASTRAGSACPYCDTDFRCRFRSDLAGILTRCQRRLRGTQGLGCVLTGGEPLLQADGPLIEGLSRLFAWVDLETNGTRACPVHPANLLVICSPKTIPGQPVVVEPDVWKVLLPDQQGFLDQALASGRPVFVQPVWTADAPVGPDYQAHVQACLHCCQRLGCRISVQLHKLLGVP